VILGLLIAVLVIAGLVAVGSQKRRGRHEDRPRTAEEQIARLIRDTAEVRGLAFERSVHPEFLTSDELAAEIRRQARKQGVPGLPPVDVLIELGLAEPGTDLEAINEEASAASVIGFYDPESKRLVVQSGTELLSPLGQVTLVHELTHAVTDQHFDLSAYLTGKEGDDEFEARVALVEGDATLAMGRWQSEHLSLSDQISSGFESVFASLGGGAPGPAIMGTFSVFPYLSGMQFVQQVYDAGGWDAVNRAYREPPTTTEEILHPEIYLEGGDPSESLRDLVGNTPEGTRTGEVGELFLLALLSEQGVTNAVSAAQGWDGGAWTALTLGHRAQVSLVTHWDSDEDAREFFDALVAWVRARFPDAFPETALGEGVFETSAGCFRVTTPAPLSVRLDIRVGSCL
jgi:hypothetical protein